MTKYLSKYKNESKKNQSVGDYFCLSELLFLYKNIKYFTANKNISFFQKCQTFMPQNESLLKQ